MFTIPVVVVRNSISERVAVDVVVVLVVKLDIVVVDDSIKEKK